MRRTGRLLLVLSCVFALAFLASALSMSSRIVGGETAPEHAYPYQASIRVGADHKCSGSLLNNNWILTSAHCLVKYDPSSFIVVVGSNSLIFGGFAFCARETRLHPNYVQGELHDDIALLKLCKPATFGDKVQPVQLPSEDVREEENLPAVLTGWGSSQVYDVQKGGPKSFSLKLIELPTIGLDRCRETFPSVTRSNICTFAGVGQGLCYGDAGNPLVAEGVQIGIGSWGSPCALGYPDVFTRVYSYVDWIRGIIADES
ncbi:serine protease homolog 126 isoform X3 [Nasonia vitripennis]|uniref:Peptidase S1 domain-containing protein n=1 Tax=Nasonia vitripennis TaxID=7425 RepID=A0A7M7IM26_NASVI|nr:serine protease homolog 126 isoform X3 [Nasonia vitripennis]